MPKLTEIIRDSWIFTGKVIAAGTPGTFALRYYGYCVQKGFNVSNLKEAYKDVQDAFFPVTLILMGTSLGCNLITNYIRDNFEIVHERKVYTASSGRRYVEHPPKIRRKHKPIQ